MNHTVIHIISGILIIFLIAVIIVQFKQNKNILKMSEQKKNSIKNNKDYYIEIPRDWEVQKNYNGLAFLAKRPRDNTQKENFTENVSLAVEKLPSNISVEEYTKQAVKSMKTNLNDYITVKSQKGNISGYDAVRLISEFKQSGFHIRSVTYIITAGQKAFSLTGTAQPSTFDKYKNTFETIAKSLKIYK